MNPTRPPDDARFDVSVEPAPRQDVVEAEEDEESKRRREAELASTYDQSLAHHGKTEEEMIEERQVEARHLADAAIAAAIVVAVVDAADDDNAEPDVEDAVPPADDDGGD